MSESIEQNLVDQWAFKEDQSIFDDYLNMEFDDEQLAKIEEELRYLSSSYGGNMAINIDRYGSDDLKRFSIMQDAQSIKPRFDKAINRLEERWANRAFDKWGDFTVQDIVEKQPEMLESYEKRYLNPKRIIKAHEGYFGDE